MCLCIFRIYSPSRGDFNEVMNGQIILVKRDDKKLFSPYVAFPVVVSTHTVTIMTGITQQNML